MWTLQESVWWVEALKVEWELLQLYFPVLRETNKYAKNNLWNNVDNPIVRVDTGTLIYLLTQGTAWPAYMKNDPQHSFLAYI